MPTLPPELRELIESGPMVHLSTVNPDGSPHVTVIWIGLDGGDLVSTHMRDNIKLRKSDAIPASRSCSTHRDSPGCGSTLMQSFMRRPR